MIEYITEIFDDWESLAHRDSELKEKIESLKKENRELKQEKTVVIDNEECDNEIEL